MLQKKVNAIGYELITDSQGKFPFVNSISEIDGICGITLASELLSNSYGGKGILLGGIPGISPVEIIILGAGVAGTVAARAAMSLGATVKVFDHDINRLRKIQRCIGPHLFTSTYHENVLRNAFKTADVAIGTQHHFNEYNRFRISEELVRSMKKGAVILDLSIGQGGGSFETSEFDNEKKSVVYEQFGVLHYCIFNISSRVARTASMAISNCLLPLLLQVENYKYFNNILKTDAGFKSGIYLYKGHVVNRYIGNFFNLPTKNIELYLGGF